MLWLFVGIGIGMGVFTIGAFSLAHVFKNMDNEGERKTPQPQDNSFDEDEHLAHINPHQNLVIDEDLGNILPFPHHQKWRENQKK